MPDKTVKSQAFRLKGRLYTLTVLHVQDANPETIALQLAELTAKAPRLFEHAPLVLDVSAFDDATLDINAIVDAVRGCGLFPVALQGAMPGLTHAAKQLGLGVLNSSSTNDKPLEMHDEAMPQTVAASAVPSEGGRNKTITAPVRSGQQVVGKGGDLIVAASVSHGAELLADGNIHVYGPLRGRALAGISGDRSARIFCQSLEADLVSIAGFYRLSDAIQPFDRPCQIYLEGDSLQIEPL
ncbi:septum site-determining protein MinC [Legionella geestiana]|uniref:septum site-determining protein MinC n=1 Tax=Legionella geestiana TaxID=45065 RepID=UPI0010925311|nr:septum site-determining protein MinC [Legionella geestiana]QDQ40757.1 septum site-determining protein MinC [Legionella geestiana]